MSAGRNPQSLSNSLPRIEVEVMFHRRYLARVESQRALSALRLAEARLKKAGYDLRAVREVDEMARRGAEWFAKHQENLFTVAEAVGFGVAVETPASTKVTTDVSAQQHRAGLVGEGRAAAVRGDAREPYYCTEDDDRAAWLEGYDAFAADLAAFEAAEQAARVRPARTPKTEKAAA